MPPAASLSKNPCFHAAKAGVLLQFVEASVSNLAGTKNVLTFEGFFILLEVHKKFSGNTIVVTDKGRIKNLLKEMTTSHMENVRLEDPVFEKQFEVYSTDQEQLTKTQTNRQLKNKSYYYIHYCRQCSGF